MTSRGKGAKGIDAFTRSWWLSWYTLPLSEQRSEHRGLSVRVLICLKRQRSNRIESTMYQWDTSGIATRRPIEQFH